jgi:polysaccharide biosynthesis protein PslH
MRILWVKANKILPLHSGGDIRSFNILRQLALSDEVVFLSYYEGSRDSHYEAELEKLLPGCVCVSTGTRQESKTARAWDYLRRLPSAAPYAVSRFRSPTVQKRLRQCISGKAPDVVVCDFLDAAVNFPDSLATPWVLFQHNVESEIWRRHATNGSGWAMKSVYRLEFSKMLRYEQSAMRRFDHVVAVSEHDKKLMSAWADSKRITVVPTGVDTEMFSPGEPRDQPKPLVMFVGAMDWEPNVDAVKYFCAEMWPQILAAVPGACFRIVGRNPDRRVTALVSESVEVTGRVPSVVDHLREAVVVVVPLRIGGGTRLKIYEAMAVGKAVVSTTVGAEGLDVNDGKDVLLADSPAGFRNSVITLLKDSDLRRQQERAALALAGSYGWPRIGARFGEVLRQVVAKHSPALPAGAELASAMTES